MKIYFVLNKYHHHREYSGYDQLVKYIPHKKVFSQNILESGSLLSKILRSLIYRIYGNFHHLLEYRIRFRLSGRSAIVHYLYPQNHYQCFGTFKGNNKIIATLHQPVDYYKNQFKDLSLLESYKKIDRFIVMSNSLKDYIDDILGRNNTIFIPHGVDTDFFKPGNAERISHSVLMVGNWLRDFEFARDVFKNIFAVNKNIKVTVISKPADKKYFQGLSFVTFKTGITSQELRNEYQRNSLLFLPLINCTANNALLEGLACGIPICISNLKNAFDYVDKDKVLTFDHKVEECRDILLNVLDNQHQMEKLSQFSLEMAKRYEWPLIAKQTVDAY